MKKEDSIPVSTRLSVEELTAIKISGESNSEFLANAVRNRLVSENLDFVNKSLQDVENQKKVLLLRKTSIEKKLKEKENIPKKEGKNF